MFQGHRGGKPAGSSVGGWGVPNGSAVGDTHDASDEFGRGIRSQVEVIWTKRHEKQSFFLVHESLPSFQRLYYVCLVPNLSILGCLPSLGTFKVLYTGEACPYHALQGSAISRQCRGLQRTAHWEFVRVSKQTFNPIQIKWE